jgi:hypothetical protein
VPKSEIDELYLVRPYYIVPDGKVGHDAYAVIRETIRTMDKVAIARLVLTNREHIVALQARGKGLVGMLLRYPYEIRDENTGGVRSGLCGQDRAFTVRGRNIRASVFRRPRGGRPVRLGGIQSSGGKAEQDRLPHRSVALFSMEH